MSRPYYLRSNGSSQAGFTVPELIIMMVVTTLLTLLVFSFAVSFWSTTATLQSDSDTLATRLNADDALRRLLESSSGLIEQNSILDPYAANPDPVSGNNYWVTIHAIPGNTPVGTTGTTTPLLYSQAPSIDASKNMIMNGSQPYQDQFVLYLNGTTKQLLLRNLANPSATGDQLKTSCPANHTTSTCLADRIISDNVSSVDTRYFSRSGNTIDFTSITDPNTGNYAGPDFPAVDVVELTLHLYHQSTLHGGTNTLNQTTIRVALRNS
jgi:hypothetical protein